MTPDQIKEAHMQMLVYVKVKEASYRAGGEYESMTAREVLTAVGYEREQTDEVLHAIAKAGFDYCLDPIIGSAHEERTPRFACVWGVDQLRSRLDCVRL